MLCCVVLRYGRVQNVKLLAKGLAGGATGAMGGESGTGSGLCAAVAFMDIKSAAKAHMAEHTLDERPLTTVYYEPAAIPSSASAGSSPAGSGYSASSGSVNSAPQPRFVAHGWGCFTFPFTLAIQPNRGHTCLLLFLVSPLPLPIKHYSIESQETASFSPFIEMILNLI